MTAVNSQNRLGGRDLAEADGASGSIVTGKVKWYDAVKGYGFVIPDDGGGDVMVHASCVRNYGITTLAE
ncbi:MAG: cold shock domain-containing protein, partial [Pseudomonadota bacterium]